VSHTDEQYAIERLLADMKATPIAHYNPRPTVRKFHLDGHRTRFLFGGKQSSKSYGVTAEVSMSITGIESIHTPGALKKFRPPPVQWRHWCEDLTRVAVGILYPIYRKLIPEAMLDRRRGRNLPGFNTQTNTLHLTNGSSVQFMSYEMPDMKGESATLDGVAFDEPPPEKLYESQYMRILARAGKMIGAMTLDERRASYPIAWMDRRIRRRGDGKHVAWWRVPTMENIKALMREAPTQAESEGIWSAFEDATESFSDAERKVVLEGLGGWAIGLIFPDFDDEVQAAYDKLGPEDVAELARKGYGIIRGGLDAGLDDPTAMNWVYTHGPHALGSLDLAEGDHLVYREYKVRGYNYTQHAARLAYLSKDEPIQGVWASPELWTRDKNGGPVEGHSFFTAFKQVGISVRRGSKHKRVRLERLGEWMRVRPHPPWSRLRFLKNKCQENVDECYGYSFKPEQRRTGKRPDEAQDTNDHLIECLGYWAMSFPETRRHAQRRVQTLPCHEITGVPMANYVDLGTLVRAIAGGR
jgi:phage terminase large subunit-like protein